MRKKGPRAIPDFSRHPTTEGAHKSGAPAPSKQSPRSRGEAPRPQVKPQATSAKSGQRGQ